MLDHGDTSPVQFFRGNRPCKSSLKEVNPFSELKVRAVVVGAAVSATKLTEEQIGCNLLGLHLLVEGSFQVNFSGAVLDTL